MKPEQENPCDSSNAFETCLECQRPFPPSEMLFLNRCWICAECKPVFLQKWREVAGLEGISGLLWRDKDCVVIRIGTQMPDRCYCCNAPVTTPKIAGRFSWLSNRYGTLNIMWQLLLVVLLFAFKVPFGIRLGLIAASWFLLMGAMNFFTHRFSLRMSLCKKHHRRMLWNWIATICLLLAAVGVLAMWGVSVVYGISSARWMPVVSIVALLLMGLIYSRVRTGRLRPTLVAHDFAWLKGAGREFLGSLPEWPGRDARDSTRMNTN